MTDALGNEIIIGNWYGYSRNDGGFSHTTVGKALKVTEADLSQYRVAKVRLGNCKVTRYLYGQLTDYEKDKVAKDLSMATFMLFPVPNQDGRQ